MIQFVLKKTDTDTIRNFLSPMSVSKQVAVSADPSKGVTIFYSDIDIKGYLTLSIHCKGEAAQFLIGKEQFLKILSSTENELIVETNNMGMEVNIDGTILNLSHAFIDEGRDIVDPEPAVEAPTASVVLSPTRIANLVGYMEVAKAPKSVVFSIIELAALTKTGNTMHSVIIDTPEFEPFTVSITNVFQRCMKALAHTEKDIKFLKNTITTESGTEGIISAHNGIMSFYTPVSEIKFEKVEGILAEEPESVTQIVEMPVIERFKSTADKLMIPLLGQEEPLANLKVSKDEVEIVIKDVGGRLSKDKFTSLLQEGKETQALVNFAIFRDVLSSARSVPIDIKVKEGCIVIEQKGLKEVIFKYL